MFNQYLKQPFYISTLGGILVWVFIFLITPATVTSALTLETILFIFLSYLTLIFGYNITPNINISTAKVFSSKFVFYYIIFILICYLIRFIDVFYIRGLRFSNSIYQNRLLAQNGPNNLLLIIASALKSTYFIPLLLLLLTKKKKFLFIASFLFILPSIEAFLRGSRNTFFQSFIFFVLILIYTKSVKFNKKNLLLFALSLVTLFIISTQILISREGPKNKNPYTYLVEKAIHNDFLKPKQQVVDFMNNPKISNTKKKISLSALQIGQYYTHGLFEFDYVVKHYQKNLFKKQHGKYTFTVISKFTNIFHITNFDLNKVYKASPRGYTFISFFGGMYLDFGWFSLFFFLLLGAIQKIVYCKFKQNNFAFAPLLIFLLFVNFFMLTFNFFKGSGTYTLISCIIFAITFSMKFKVKSI